MKGSVNTSLIANMDQQELQHLITVSTGFIDAYIIECNDQVPMLLPQNIVLSAMDVKNGVKHIEWHDVKLPVYSVHNTIDQHAVALVIEGEDISQRFALICKTMPVSTVCVFLKLSMKWMSMRLNNTQQYLNMCVCKINATIYLT